MNVFQGIRTVNTFVELERNKRKHGEKCHFVRIRGHSLYGKPQNWTVLVENFGCPVPVITNGVAILESGISETSADAVVRIECDPLFGLRGQSVSSCSCDRVWNPPLPTCMQSTYIIFLNHLTRWITYWSDRRDACLKSRLKLFNFFTLLKEWRILSRATARLT